MKLVYLALAAVILSACAGNTEVEGERVTVQNGVVTNVCGEGNGLPECTDYNNRPYSENLEMKEPTDKQMEREAAKVRSESPEELERTISELEQNPNTIDTMEE
jgi:Tfp pilus assembly protein PilP